MKTAFNCPYTKVWEILLIHSPYLIVSNGIILYLTYLILKLNNLTNTVKYFILTIVIISIVISFSQLIIVPLIEMKEQEKSK